MALKHFYVKYTVLITSSVPGEFMGLFSQYPSVSKSNPLHVDNFQWKFFFVKNGVYSLNSSKMIMKSWTSTDHISNLTIHFFKLNRFMCN